MVDRATQTDSHFLRDALEITVPPMHLFFRKKKNIADESLSRSQNIKSEFMNWETKAKSLKLIAGLCKGFPSGAGVLSQILLKLKGLLIIASWKRGTEWFVFWIFSLITLTSCYAASTSAICLRFLYQLRLPPWKLIAQPENTVPGYFGARGKKGEDWIRAPLLASSELTSLVRIPQPHELFSPDSVLASEGICLIPR